MINLINIRRIEAKKTKNNSNKLAKEVTKKNFELSLIEEVNCKKNDELAIPKF